MAAVAQGSTTISSNITTGGTLTVSGATSLDGGAFTFNDSSADLDFRVESNDQTHMIFIDGGNDKVGIASSSPYVALGVTGTTTSSAGMVIGAAGSGITQLLFGTCTVNPNDGPLAEGVATSTTCTASGVTSADTISVTPANLPAGLVMLSATSTTNAINIMIGSTSSTSPDITTYASWSWVAIK